MPETYFSKEVAKILQITVIEANVLAKFLRVKKIYRAYFWTKEKIEEAKEIINRYAKE